MVNPSPAPTQPEGSELPTFIYGSEGIPRVLKLYRFSPHGYMFPIRWSDQPNQSERLIYEPLAWITTDSGHGLVSSLCQAINSTNFDLQLTAPLGTDWSNFLVAWKKYLEMICKLWSSYLGLNVLKASFPQARYITIIQTRCIYVLTKWGRGTSLIRQWATVMWPLSAADWAPGTEQLSSYLGK